MHLTDRRICTLDFPRTFFTTLCLQPVEIDPVSSLLGGHACISILNYLVRRTKFRSSIPIYSTYYRTWVLSILVDMGTIV
jgi:hypothetical protein